MRYPRARVFIPSLLATAFVACSPGHLSKADLEPSKPIRFVSVREKVIALTYDDGPHPIYTPAILRELRLLNAKATFFMIGKQMERWPDITRAVTAEGHAIANHTYSHPIQLASENHQLALHEIEQCDATIKRLTGHGSAYVRPPKGLQGRQLPGLVQQEGYTMVLWSVSAYRHDCRSPEQMAQRVISRVKPGSIVLMHDGSYRMRWRDVEATPLIIKGLRARGYRFVTVPELLSLERQHPL